MGREEEGLLGIVVVVVVVVVVLVAAELEQHDPANAKIKKLS